MKRSFFLNSLILSLAIISCSNKKETVVKSNHEVDSKKLDSSKIDKNNDFENKEIEDKINVSFTIKTKSQDDIPSSDISISIDGKYTFIENIVGEASIMNEIGGEKSLSACGSWFAGVGTYFYASCSKNGITIFKGWRDEGQQVEDYHWESFKEIKL